MAEKSGVTNDAAARLLGISPAELDQLAKNGRIRRNDRNSYSVPVLVEDYVAHLKNQIGAAGHPKQTDVGLHLDLSERSVREWESKLNLPEDYTLADFRVAYIRQLREEAAGRSAQGAIDLPTERALLAREQRIGQSIKNEVARGTYAPIEALTDVMASASQAVVDHLDQIPAGIARVCPDLPQAVRDLLMSELARARNEMVRKTASLIADALDPVDIQEEEAEPLSTADED